MADEEEKEDQEEETKEGESSGTAADGEWKTVGKKKNRNFDHPVYKSIAKLNGYVNRLHKNEIVNELRNLGLDHRYASLDDYSVFSNKPS